MSDQPIPPAKLDPDDPNSLQWLNDHTIFFDLRDDDLGTSQPISREAQTLTPDPEELAAARALKKIRRRTYLKNRIQKTKKRSPLGVGSAPVAPLDVLPTQSAPDEKKRVKGGQPGNSNALKYGFYSRRIPDRELEGLDQTAVTSLKDEIDVMRVFSRKVAELGSNVDDLEQATGLLRVLSLATTSINRLVRTHTRIPDPDLDPALLLKTALLELEDEWPELKAFGDQFRDKPSSTTPPPTDRP